MYRLSEVKISTDKNGSKRLRKDEEVYVKNGCLKTNPSLTSDAHFQFSKDNLLVDSQYAFILVPAPFCGNLFKFFIFPQMYENVIVIGNTIIEFELNQESTKYIITARRKDLHKSHQAISQDLNTVIKISRDSDFLSEMKDDRVSTDHCYFGYDSTNCLFFVIDYGSLGNGSTNGTYIKLKSQHNLIKRNTTIRIMRNDSIDYRIECVFVSQTQKD